MGRKVLEWLFQPAGDPQPAPEAASQKASEQGSSGASAPPASSPDTERDGELAEARANQAKLRRDLEDLMKAHGKQTRMLERNQRTVRRLEETMAQMRERTRSLESQLDQAVRTAAEHAARGAELKALGTQHDTLKAAHEALARERQGLASRLSEITLSRDTLQAEHDRLAVENATAHATLAAREAEVAALRVAEDALKERVAHLSQEVADGRAAAAHLQGELDRIAGLEAEYTRLKLEHEAVSARCEVALAQLAEAEQALETAQATIKAAQRLSGSLEWRSALDSVLDAASELVRFERGTLAIVDTLLEELKVEVARNSPIAVSEMSRFKLGEGIAGWALSRHEPVLVRDSRSDPRYKASDPTHRPRSIIAVPLVAGADGLGVLTLTRPANDPFDEKDLRNLVSIGNNAVRALTNAQLVHVLKQRQDELSTLVAKTKELWAAGDAQQVVASILKSAREMVGGKAALLALRNASKHGLEVEGFAGVPPELVDNPVAWGAPAALDVMRSGKPWVAPMHEILPPALMQQVEAAGMRMLISLPCQTSAVHRTVGDGLMARSAPSGEVSEDVHGVLHIFLESPENISPEQLEQLKAFSEQAANAIKQVRRWERIKGQLQTAASLNARLMGRERYIQQLQFRIQQLEQELGRYKAA